MSKLIALYQPTLHNRVKSFLNDHAQKYSRLRCLLCVKGLVICWAGLAVFNKSKPIEIIKNKARHNLVDAKCRWRSDRLDGAGNFREPLGQTKVMQVRQGETLNHQGAITHEVCCLAAQLQHIP